MIDRLLVKKGMKAGPRPRGPQRHFVYIQFTNIILSFLVAVVETILSRNLFIHKPRRSEKDHMNKKVKIKTSALLQK